jgi:hypothetical protein
MFRLKASPQAQKLAERFPKKFSLKQGIPVLARSWKEPGFEIRPADVGVEVWAGGLSEHFRALGELMAWPAAEPWRKRRVAPAMDFRGLMIDASRNGVMRPEFFQSILPDLALMGFSHVCMYTEDTFEVPGHPLIGYRRGRYSRAELKGMAQAAAGFGLEMFPCIQTLGHLSQILKFKRYGGVRDTDSVLSVKSKETYKLLEELVRAASAPFQSRLINVGMDETWDLGRGSVFTPGKAVHPRRLYLEHVVKVMAICRKAGLKPMMWGDILMHGNLGDGSPHAAPIPRGMEVAYWDYWSEDRKGYARNIDKCRAWGFEPFIAPGLLTEDRHWSFHAKMELACGAFMETAKAKGVRRALLTRWGDDGTETPFRAAYASLAFFAEHCWRQKPEPVQTRRLAEAVSGAVWEDFTEPVRLECLDERALHSGANCAKALFWDDPLLRLYGVHVGKQRLAGRLKPVADGPLARAARRASPANRRTFAYIQAFGRALAAKVDLGNEACAAYLSGNRAKLRKLAASVPAISRLVEEVWQAHRDAWLEEKRPFGLEVLDVRYGGLLRRLEAFRQEVQDYLSGKVAKIEEYEEPGQKYLGDFPNIYWIWRTYNAVTTITTGR